MKNLRFSFEELEGKPFFAILTIIQLIASFIVIYVCMSTSNAVNDKAEIVNKMFNDKNYYTLNSNNTNHLLNIDTDYFQEFMNKMDSKKVDIYSVRNESVPIKCDVPSDKIAVFGGGENGYSQVKVIYVNSNYINNIGIDISEGDFSTDDSSCIPVILGDGYRNQFKIGDKIEASDNDYKGNSIKETFLVTGFAKKGSVVCINASPDNIMEIDNYIIVKSDLNLKMKLNKYSDSNKEMSEKIRIFNYFTNSYYDFKQTEDIKEIEKSTSSNGLNFKFESNKEKIDEFMAQNLEYIWQIRVFLIFVLFFVIISIIIVMINSIVDKSKEYGINMMVGASNKDIAYRILYQIIFLFSTSLLVSLFVIWKYMCDDISIIMSFKNVFELIIICAFMCAFTCIMPVRKLKKMSLNSIMKGSE